MTLESYWCSPLVSSLKRPCNSSTSLCCSLSIFVSSTVAFFFMNIHLHVPMIWSVGLRGQVLKQCHSYMLVCVYCDLCCMSKQLQQELWLTGVASHQGLCLAYHILCHPITGGGMSYRVTHLVRCGESCQYIKSCTLCKKFLQSKRVPQGCHKKKSNTHRLRIQLIPE